MTIRLKNFFMANSGVGVTTHKMNRWGKYIKYWAISLLSDIFLMSDSLILYGIFVLRIRMYGT